MTSQREKMSLESLKEMLRRPLVAREPFLTHLSVLDAIGIVKGTICEIVADPLRRAGLFLIECLLEQGVRRHACVALVDGKDSFDVDGSSKEVATRFLWLRCKSALQALEAATLLGRDGNIPQVIVSLALNSEKELKTIKSTAWHRLSSVAEKSGTTIFAFTPYPLIGAAWLRLVVEGSAKDQQIHLRRFDLAERLRFKIDRQRAIKS